jgi:Reverse transcriptase (RNA-dependent DNA polymerase)
LPVAFLDLSKSFERVWTDDLIFKADKFGVKGKLWRWLRSFLSNRSIRVSTQGILSSPHAITAGVPQGSVLSPTLFLIFINDIVDCCKGCTPALFADDIALWPRDMITGPHSVGEAQLSRSIFNLSQWAADWRMIFNIKKSCIVFFEAQQRTTNNSEQHSRNRIKPYQPDFYLSNEKLPLQDKFRYLGITFQKNGKWDDHFSAILPKV